MPKIGLKMIIPGKKIHSAVERTNNLSVVNETVNGFCFPRKTSLRFFFHISKPIHPDKIGLNDGRIMLACLCFAERYN